MKKKLILAAAVIAIGAFAIVPFVYAGPGRHMRAQGMRGAHGFGAGMMFAHLQHVREELDLTDEQVEQIKSIFAELHEQNAQYRDDLHGGLKGVAETLIANPNDIAGAQAQLDKQAAAEAALKANVLQATSKALNVLTPDQRAKLASLVEKHAERLERRRAQ
jgi:Spy/CpxP family protein refolding chaperone